MGELRGIGLRGRGLGGGPAYLHKKGHSLLYSGNLGQAPEGGFFRCVLGWRSAGSVLRLQGSSGEYGAFALCARDGFDRFQCSLRPVPAAASLRRRKALGKVRRSECPNGAPHTTPGCNPRYSAQPERPEGTPHTPGALTCFAVAECRGWRWGSVPRGGSAGPVLRSQGTLGPVGLSRFRARGVRVSTFLCSLRPGPAAASVCVGWVVARCRCLGEVNQPAIFWWSALWMRWSATDRSRWDMGCF